MAKLFSTVALVLVAACTNAQQLAQVTFSINGGLSYFSFITDQGTLIRIAPDGKLMEWGTESPSVRDINYYAPKLQPYLGREDYYGPEADSAYRGKLKSIGTCVFMYYGHYEVDSKVGKLRSIGNINLDYYDNFGEKNLKGKLKSIGNLPVEYYSQMENEAYRGNLKTIGFKMITYYSTFDDKKVAGRIKSIGSAAYAWYGSFDMNRSGLKSGAYRTNIDGVTYILR